MWIILSNALDDFGIREVNDVTRTGTSEKLLPQHVQIEEKKRKVMNEALHGALRIAGLVSPANYVRPSMAVKLMYGWSRTYIGWRSGHKRIPGMPSPRHPRSIRS